MTKEWKITVEGQIYTVVISDEQEALQAAYAAGRAVVGLWNRESKNGGRIRDLSPAEYVVERLEDADREFLERVIRRRLGLPWIIGETKRLVIREFCMEDIAQVPEEEGDTEADRLFYTPERLHEYMRFQYSFYEYGIWALIRKSDGRVIGTAGVTDGEYEGISALELGYHVFEPYRRNGYGTEACREILRWAGEHKKGLLYAKTDASNEASIRLAKRCGLCPRGQIYSEAAQCCYLYFWNC